MEATRSMVDELMEEVDVCPTCGGHHHDHEHDHEHNHEHNHEHDHEHHHDHDEECCCGHDHHHHDHDHDEECCCGHDHDHGHDHEHHHHHHADDVFTSWGVETPHKFSKEEMKEILETLANTDKYGMVLRAKGIVPDVTGEWIYFDLVPGEYEIRTGAPEITGKLCVIGSKIDKEELSKLFHIV